MRRADQPARPRSAPRRIVWRRIADLIDSPWLCMVLLAIAACICAAALGGCQSYTYEGPDGTRLTINRIMTDAQVGVLEASSPDGTTLRIEGLKSEAEKIAEAVARGITDGIK